MGKLTLGLSFGALTERAEAGGAHVRFGLVPKS